MNCRIRIIKIGGNVIDSPEMLQQFLSDFASIEDAKILVHGGGVMASRLQKALGQEPVMMEGRRITDGEALKAVTMVYAGWCSKNIVALLQSLGCSAAGLSGADADLIRAEKRPAGSLDYGFVGDVSPDGINTGILRRFLNSGITPVICAITHDGCGQLLNTNADTIAYALAAALASSGTEEISLTYCFEKEGVLYDRDDDSSLIPVLDYSMYCSLKEAGRIASGMIPKLDNAFAALRCGVSNVTVTHACNLLNGKGSRIILHKP